MDTGRNQFFTDGPLEHPLDPSDSLVCLRTAEALCDEMLTNGLEPERSEFIGLRIAIELIQRANGVDHTTKLFGRRPQVRAILFRKLQSGNKGFGNKQSFSVRGDLSGRHTGRQSSLCQNSCVLLTALSGTEFPKVDVPTVNDGSGLT